MGYNECNDSSGLWDGILLVYGMVMLDCWSVLCADRNAQVLSALEPDWNRFLAYVSIVSRSLTHGHQGLLTF